MSCKHFIAKSSIKIKTIFPVLSMYFNKLYTRGGRFVGWINSYFSNSFGNIKPLVVKTKFGDFKIDQKCFTKWIRKSWKPKKTS